MNNLSYSIFLLILAYIRIAGPLFLITPILDWSNISIYINHANKELALWGNIRAPNQPPKLLEQLRNEIRRRHYSANTEKTYSCWVHQYILYHQKQHPKELGKEQIRQGVANAGFAPRLRFRKQSGAQCCESSQTN
ncbi:phage integrase N-terminal SAM-like domain-containing protein [Ketobacter alkanivorans]|uniref:phage integrase N-terminal SAM-like domain-containing protein n=1 Tax=Ketobacter alkanivorans TaxID=1917421 RepID=UPI001315AAE6